MCHCSARFCCLFCVAHAIGPSGSLIAVKLWQNSLYGCQDNVLFWFAVPRRTEEKKTLHNFAWIMCHCGWTEGKTPSSQKWCRIDFIIGMLTVSLMTSNQIMSLRAGCDLGHESVNKWNNSEIRLQIRSTVLFRYMSLQVPIFSFELCYLSDESQAPAAFGLPEFSEFTLANPFGNRGGKFSTQYRSTHPRSSCICVTVS